MKAIHNKNKEIGASIIETMLVFPIILFLGFGVVFLGLVFQAQSNLEYAALMGARVGASTGIDILAMENEIAARMTASDFSPGGNANLVNIEVLNPTHAMFDSCGQVPTSDVDGCIGNCVIPNFALQLRPTTPNCNGASIQDANLLRIKVNYLYQSNIPFLGNIRFVADDDGFTEATNGIVVSAVATVRMQVAALRTTFNAANIAAE